MTQIFLFIGGMKTIMQKVLGSELTKLSSWVKVNKSSVNIDKVTFMLFGTNTGDKFKLSIYLWSSY